MVTGVEPSEQGVQATLSIDSRFQIPVDASANVHSVSAVGEQYIDLVSEGNSDKYFAPGQTITKATVPSPIGPTLDGRQPRSNRAAPGEDRFIARRDGAGGWWAGTTLHRLVDSTQALAGDFKTNMTEINDIIENSAPIIDSQVNSGGSIKSWSANLNTISAQTASNDQELKAVLSNAAPTADQFADVLSSVRESLPQTLANLEIVLDMLKRYHAGIEQLLVILPQASSIIQTLLCESGLRDP